MLDLTKTMTFTADQLRNTRAGMPCELEGYDGKYIFQGVSHCDDIMTYCERYGFEEDVCIPITTIGNYLNYTVPWLVPIAIGKWAKEDGDITVFVEEHPVFGKKIVVRNSIGHNGVSGVVFHEALAEIIGTETLRVVDGEVMV
jgi:hypothetical protein